MATNVTDRQTHLNATLTGIFAGLWNLFPLTLQKSDRYKKLKVDIFKINKKMIYNKIHFITKVNYFFYKK